MRPPFDRMIADVIALRDLSGEESGPRSASGQLIFSYLAANGGLLTSIFQGHYKHTAQEERMAVARVCPMIDGSTVSAGFEAIALEAVRKATECWTGLNRIHRDDLQMLIRGLQAVQHHRDLTGTFQGWCGVEAVVLLSPVSDYWPVLEAIYDSAKLAGGHVK